jgi:hypothetical protein
MSKEGQTRIYDFHACMAAITEATPHRFKILEITAFISKEIQYATTCLASAYICIPGHIIKLRNER